MSFPTIVYRCPGDHQLPGGSYSYRGVNDAEQLKEALVCGWFKTIGEAIEGKAGAPVEDEPLDEISPPTREELEAQAKELDIAFNARTSDEKLLERINEKLA
jgi:hypothetical protein